MNEAARPREAGENTAEVKKVLEMGANLVRFCNPLLGSQLENLTRANPDWLRIKLAAAISKALPSHVEAEKSERQEVQTSKDTAGFAWLH